MRVLITGGSSDIGAAIAQRRLQLGDKVVITTSHPETLEKALITLRAEGLSKDAVDGFVFDLAQPELAMADVARILEVGLDGLILNAATRTPKLRIFHEMKSEEFTRFFTENTLGNIWLLRALLPHFIHARFGRMIFISSLVANTGASRYSAYAAAKGAMESLFLNLAVDYGHLDILSSIVRPGIIATSRNQRYWKRSGYIEKMSSLIPQGKIGVPEQVAEALDYLLSATSYANGSIFEVSGGFPKIRSEGLF